jgi:predicted metal-dependent phosphoesterase TrpH
MIERGEGQYPYIIFLSDDAYIPNIYVHHQYFVDMDAAVKLIRNAGGLAILAHYYSCVGKINEELLDKILRDNRLDGAEVVYGLFCLNTGTEIEKTVIKSSEIINRLVKKHSKLQSGGADAHKLKDFVDFANSGEYAEKTEGMAEEIIKQSNTDTTWSNF